MAGMSVTFLISSKWWKKSGFQFCSTVQTLRLHVTLNALLTSLTWATQPLVWNLSKHQPLTTQYWTTGCTSQSRGDLLKHISSLPHKSHSLIEITFLEHLFRWVPQTVSVQEPCTPLWTHRCKGCVTALVSRGMSTMKRRLMTPYEKQTKVYNQANSVISGRKRRKGGHSNGTTPTHPQLSCREHKASLLQRGKPGQIWRFGATCSQSICVI